MNVIEITDISAPELSPFARLTEAQLRHSGEGGSFFIAESAKVVESAVAAGYEPVSFLTERKRLPAVAGVYPQDAFPEDLPVFTGAPELLETLTGYRLSRGVLALMRRKPLPSVEAVAANARFAAVLEGITDQTNMGAIFRSAAALGADAVFVGSSCCDPLSRRAARVSMGTVFKVPWTVLPCLAENKKRTNVGRLRALGFVTAAMALAPDAAPINDPSVPRGKKLAVLLGSEGNGLEPGTVADCDIKLVIPMANGVDSLNVAAAAAVTFYALAPGKK